MINLMVERDLSKIKILIDDPSVIKLIQDQQEELSDEELLKIEKFFCEKFDALYKIDLASLIYARDPLADQIQTSLTHLMDNWKKFVRGLPKERAEKLGSRSTMYLPTPISKMILPTLIALGILGSIWVIFFTDTYDSSSSQIDTYDSSSSQIDACIEKSEKQFESCLYRIPGTASESDMNYCLDLHEARSYGCRTGRRR
ncbi:MAG: hypothetical protein VX241_03745 [Pseudomonadota bacterium]|nr:hypothetical protein [Pseudomonadota bacterium]